MTVTVLQVAAGTCVGVALAAVVGPYALEPAAAGGWGVLQSVMHYREGLSW